MIHTCSAFLKEIAVGAARVLTAMKVIVTQLRLFWITTQLWTISWPGREQPHWPISHGASGLTPSAKSRSPGSYCRSKTNIFRLLLSLNLGLFPRLGRDSNGPGLRQGLPSHTVSPALPTTCGSPNISPGDSFFFLLFY